MEHARFCALSSALKATEWCKCACARDDKTRSRNPIALCGSGAGVCVCCVHAVCMLYAVCCMLLCTIICDCHRTTHIRPYNAFMRCCKCSEEIFVHINMPGHIKAEQQRQRQQGLCAHGARISRGSSLEGRACARAAVSILFSFIIPYLFL